MSPIDWRYILHADLDAFYASVEQLDNTKYKGLPLVVGGSPEQRGVVAAASYEARRYGIRSAMPMWSAFKLCPTLIRVSPRFGRYQEISREVMSVFYRLTSLVETLSLDEAYMDISNHVGMEEVHRIAHELKSDVLKVTGLVVSIGGGSSKVVAKIASQLAKPNGMLLVKPGEEIQFLSPVPVDMLWGVGPKTKEILDGYKIYTIGQLQVCDQHWLSRMFGVRGFHMKDRSMGVDNQPVETNRDTKSVSSEVTMEHDLDDEDQLLEKLRQVSGRVASRLRKSSLSGRTVTVKLRLSNFTTITRQKTMDTSTDDPDVIAGVARDILKAELTHGYSYRLVGVTVSGFHALSVLPLFPDI